MEFYRYYEILPEFNGIQVGQTPFCFFLIPILLISSGRQCLNPLKFFWQGKNHIYWEKWSLAAILFIFFYLYLLSLSIYFYEQKVLQGVGKFPVPSLVISMEYGFKARGLIWARISQLFFTINKKKLCSSLHRMDYLISNSIFKQNV